MLLRLSLISFIGIFLIIGSCADGKSESKPPKQEDIYLTEEDLVFDYEYSKDLLIYLQDNFAEEVTIREFDSLLFIPLNSCAGCVEYTLMATALNAFSGKVIIGGDPDDFEVFQPYVEEIMGQVDDIYLDSTYAMYEYVIEVGGPTMLLKKNETWRIIELSVANWPIIVGILNWKAPQYNFE